MSVNNSVCEPLEDAADLPDLYNRELTRKKISQIQYTNNSDVGAGTGGYREWKAKNGMDVSDKMVSTLGRALHNQGVISHGEGNFYDSNGYRDGFSNSAPGAECHVDHHNPRLNYSEPCFSSQQHLPRNQELYRDVAETHLQGVGHTNGRPYHYVNGRVNQEDYSCDAQYNSKCLDPCCSNQIPKSPGNSPKNHSVQHNYRQNQSHNYHYQKPEVHQDYRSPPCPKSSHFQPVHNQPRQCPVNPPSCHCLNSNETPHRSVSPPKKLNSNKKSDASIKKLYRILWLQNEQLGLLEKQVSKLIELNFSKESNEKVIKKACDEKPVEEVSQPKKPETFNVATMTDFPCHKCQLSEKKLSPSESEPETPKKPVDESLTLHGVDIPVNREEFASPPVSMHIDMQEFQTSSSETDESDTTEEESEPVGWTFYDNVVGQVNNILKTASKKKRKNKKNAYIDESNLPIEHMNRLGLGLPSPDYDTHNPKRVTFEEERREQQINLRAQSEISMNWNALASKYLSSTGGKVQDMSLCNVISSNTNMSLATMRYLERHQIANRDVMDNIPKKNARGSSKKSRSSGEKAVTSKFLDITAIRQQPKLLPKDM